MEHCYSIAHGGLLIGKIPMDNEINNQTIVDAEGKIIHYSVDKFIHDICEGDCCFICGASQLNTVFNDEHVWPKWLLKEFNLYDEVIKLGNNTTFTYSRYTTICCETCNSRMGEEIETPVKKILSLSAKEIKAALKESSKRLLIYRWLASIFLKVHLRNRSFRMVLDRRIDAGRIADNYDWSTLYQLHSVVRSFYTGVYVDSSAVGSLFAVESQDYIKSDLFDHMEIYHTRSMFVRLKKITLFVGFDDSQRPMEVLHGIRRKIDYPLNRFQVYEIFAELSDIIYRTLDHPKFSLTTHDMGHDYRLSCSYGKLTLRPPHLGLRGQILARSMEGVDLGDNMKINGLTGEAAKRHLEKGTYSFLFDSKGNFTPIEIRPSASDPV